MLRSSDLRLPSASIRRQSQGKVDWNESRSLEKADFYTIGYSGRTLEDVINVLQERTVKTLVDVRTHPVSMHRPETSKSNLRHAVLEAGIQYEHMPELGVPRDIRALSIRSGNRAVIWEWYDQYVAGPYLAQNLHAFFNCLEHPVALMCTELDPHECHRHRLALKLEHLGLSGFDL